MAELFNFSRIEEKHEFQKFELQKIHKRQNDRKGRYQGAMKENCKKVKIEVIGPQKVHF